MREGQGLRAGASGGWGNCSLAVSWTGVAFIRVATRQPQPQATTRLKLILHTCPMWQKQDSTMGGERGGGMESEREREGSELNVLLFCKGYTQSERSNKPVKLYLHATRCLQCPCYKYADAWRKIQARYKLEEEEEEARQQRMRQPRQTKWILCRKLWKG